MRSLSLILALSFLAVNAHAAGLRKCAFTGMSARCGDAKSIVSCEGYDDEHYLADDEKVQSLELILWKGEPSLNRKVVRGYATLQNGRASFRSYELSLTHYDQLLLKGETVTADQDSRTAVEDLQRALKHRNPKIRVGAEDNLDIGVFTIRAEAKLYKTCNKSSGEAPQKSPPTAEEQRKLDQKSEEQRRHKELSEKFGVEVTRKNEFDWEAADSVISGKIRATSCNSYKSTAIIGGINVEHDGLNFSGEGKTSGFIYESSAQELVLKFTGLSRGECTPAQL